MEQLFQTSIKPLEWVIWTTLMEDLQEEKKESGIFGTQMQKGKGGIQKGHFYSFKVF